MLLRRLIKMNYTSVLEKVDNFVYGSYNFIARTLFAFKFGVKKRIAKNKALKNSHNGERCFIVLNGPSVKNYDLELIKNEYTICTNYFFRSEIVDVVRPNFYCWSDGNIFDAKNKDVFDEMMNKCNYSTFFFGSRALNLDFLQNKDNVYFTYNKLRCRSGHVSSKLDGISTNFGTVAIYAINVAIYLGFKDIYILGYDFPPGTFVHFENLGKTVAEENTEFSQSKEKVCGSYRGYLCAQYDNFYMSEHAKKNQVNIYNCNPQSYVRSYKFANYQELFSKK